MSEQKNNEKKRIRGSNVKRNIWVDYFILGEIVIIGLAEAVHLATILSGWTFQRCTMWLLGAVGIVCVLLAGVLLFKCLVMAKNGRRQEAGPKRVLPDDKAEWILLIVLAMLLFSQLLFIWMGQGPYIDGDMTVETVESFL